MLARRPTTMALLAALPLMTTAAAQAQTTTPRKIVAVLDGTQNFGNTQRSVSFYDVTDLSGANVFGQQPLFSVWTGYEDAISSNYEDPQAITVNPINGTVYVASFDSGTPGNVDGTGDTEGDFDLYRIDYQEVLNDFLTNNRARGTMYAPATATDGATNNPHPQHGGSTVFLNNAIVKVGEVARTQSSEFYDFDMEFVRPDRIAFLDNQTGADASGDTIANDHQIRLWERVSTSAGGATYDAGANEGGFNNQTAESWGSTNGGVVDMDTVSGGRSEPVDIAYVVRDGVEGIWVGEGDGGGDDVAFFEIDWANKTAIKREQKVGAGPYATSFALDENPVANASTNDGDLDWIVLDGEGGLVIGESGFNDTPQSEPKVIRREVTDYNFTDSDSNGQNEITFGPWSVSGNLPSPTGDDDSAVTHGQFVTYDKGTGYVYFFDIDSGGLPNVVTDVYVFDPATGSFVYQEQNAANHFMERHGIRLFTRGDTTGDGKVLGDDIDNLYSKFKPAAPDALTAEWYDLTGERSLNQADVDELVRNVLGTQYGDANLDKRVNFFDANTLRSNLSAPSGTGTWARGDFNGDRNTNFFDANQLRANLGFDGTADSVTVATFSLEAPAEADLGVTRDAIIAAASVADSGDGIADFYYNPETGELVVNDDGEAPWALVFNTTVDPLSTSTPTGWTFINEATNFQFGDNSFGGNPLDSGLDIVLALLPTGLTAADFGNVQYFIQADFNEHIGMVQIVPEPASAAMLMGIVGLLTVRRRSAA